MDTDLQARPAGIKKSFFRHWKRAVVTFSLALNVLGASMAVAVIHKKGGLPWLERKASELLTSDRSGTACRRPPK